MRCTCNIQYATLSTQRIRMVQINSTFEYISCVFSVSMFAIMMDHGKKASKFFSIISVIAPKTMISDFIWSVKKYFIHADVFVSCSNDVHELYQNPIFKSKFDIFVRNFLKFIQRCGQIDKETRTHSLDPLPTLGLDQTHRHIENRVFFTHFSFSLTSWNTQIHQNDDLNYICVE